MITSKSKQRNSSRSIVFHTSNEKFYVEPFDPKDKNWKHLHESDLYNVAVAFYELERALIQDKKKVNRLVIPIAYKTYNRIDRESVSNILNEIALFIFHSDIKFYFKPVKSFKSYQLKLTDDEVETYNAVCLFSGGADSFVGVLKTKRQYNKVLALHINHFYSPRLTEIIGNLKRDLLDKEKIRYEKIKVPSQIKGAYSQSRGLLYILCGGIYSSIYNSRNLILSECGVTMYQPPFGELDRTTYTSHPFIQKKSKELMKVFLDKDIEIITPFENNTKSEMFAMSDRKDFLRVTHSCISSRFGMNLGACYGCVIRRIGFIVSGLEDGNYKYDIFTIGDNTKLYRYGGCGNLEGRHAITEFLSLMEFSLNILQDYKNMAPSKKKKIETYQKYDLFRRFALDTFAALYLLFEKKNIGTNQSIKIAYLDARKYIDKQELEDRIKEVRSLIPQASVTIGAPYS